MEQDERITIRIDKLLLSDLDDLRRKEEDVPTRAEMLRRLIKRAKQSATPF
jgi:metal-responsive CopG/Arc/MetJ family transcriptional regulator